MTIKCSCQRFSRSLTGCRPAVAATQLGEVAAVGEVAGAARMGEVAGARAQVVREACPTSAGDEVTYGDGAPGAPGRQEGPRGSKKRDRAAADDGMVDSGIPDRGLETGASTEVHGSGTKKRRRKQSRPTARAGQRHSQRMAQFGTARDDTPGSDPGPINGHPAED